MWRDLDHDRQQDDRNRPDVSRAGSNQAERSDPLSNVPREVFTRDLDLPRGLDRERIYVHDRTYVLRGADVRTLASVGAFRVVPETDLRAADWGARDLRHLREAGLVQTQPYVVGRARTTLVTLTERGRDLLENSRTDREPKHRQQS